jgi:branched-chain amino acid transport system ATP-binding protein/branched-chain amino acid transport system permease protein
MKFWWGLGIALLALGAVPALSGGTYYAYLGIIIFIYGIVAIGLNILSGYAGQFSLGHAAFMAVGAYVAALFSKALAASPFFYLTGVHILLGIVCGTAAAALSGIVLAVPALRVRGPYLAMVTIAFGWVAWKILQEWVSVTGGDLGISAIPKPQIGTIRLDTPHFYYLVLVLFGAALIVQKRLIFSRIGLQIRAIKHSELGLSSVGIDVYRLKVIVFIISAGYAGFGGALFAHQQNYISPDNFQFFSSVFLLLAVLFGGAGTMMGPVIGAAILILLPEMLHDFDKYRLIVYGFLILGTLYFLPRGIMGFFTPHPSRRRDAEGTTLTADTHTRLPPVAGARLQIEGLSRNFGGIVALSDVSFDVAAGSIHALIGPNGAGKTTLINIASGIYRPNSGRILLDGSEAGLGSLHGAARKGIVRTFQSLKLFGDMTVLEHVLIGFALSSRANVSDAILGSQTARQEAESNLTEVNSLLRLLGIVHLAEVPAASLSYGHRRLVEIARALAARPRILLLDEPAAGLVADEIRALAIVVRRLKEAGMTILLVEHHMELVLTISDRITVLDHGTMIADGLPNEIRKNDRVVAAYLGSAHADA